MRIKSFEDKLLILQVIHEFCKNNILSVRRAEFKLACDARLSEKTNRGRVEFGGEAFQTHLNDLENERMLKQLVDKKKKLTMIHFNREKVEYFLADIEQGKPAGRTEIIPEAPFDSIWEKMIEEVYTSGIDKEFESRYGSNLDSLNNDTANKSHTLLKEYVSRAMANMMSRLFEFNISTTEGGLKLDKEFFKTMVNPLLKIAERNVKVPFKLEIDYKGVSLPPEEELKKFDPALRMLYAEYFEKWASEVFDYQISEEDKRKVEELQYYLLDKTVRDYYDIFHNSATYYTNLLYSLRLSS